ncbi:hypothetical protein TRL7639_01512 [Falsiruegeria litorea R37]|uniref:Methyltransferase FkbM domain-containing protein n=1 Tax=Falsiruegeria litorea R37 TaxID=1200284 RepID=A0A1Y5S6T8_9RHOB|nr:FkbM family methyltransferase [Falsiruegeria litorea]SLN33804.1 hypothetical protein TRL7639_01512 [Falsiruegeria litorea R37]
MHFLKGLERSAKKLVPVGWRKHFRASKYELLMERRAPIDLVVHVGAHWGEDAEFYERCGAQTILWVEADPDTYKKLTTAIATRPRTTRHVTENALVSATAGEELTFNRFNGDGASSSIYTSTDTYRERFPHSRETGEVIQMKTCSLPEILARHDIDVTSATRPMLVVDVQGHELSVLKGLGEGLKQFHQCKCEVSRVPMYDGGALFEDIDSHMKAMGFRLASHRYMQVPRHGDVLYIQG